VSKLRYEDDMEPKVYREYCEIVSKISLDPNNIFYLLDLLVFFFFKVALICFIILLKIFNLNFFIGSGKASHCCSKTSYRID